MLSNFKKPASLTSLMAGKVFKLTETSCVNGPGNLLRNDNSRDTIQSSKNSNNKKKFLNITTDYSSPTLANLPSISERFFSPRSIKTDILGRKQVATRISKNIDSLKSIVDSRNPISAKELNRHRTPQSNKLGITDASMQSMVFDIQVQSDRILATGSHSKKVDFKSNDEHKLVTDASDRSIDPAFITKNRSRKVLDAGFKKINKDKNTGPKLITSIKGRSVGAYLRDLGAANVAKGIKIADQNQSIRRLSTKSPSREGRLSIRSIAPTIPEAFIPTQDTCIELPIDMQSDQSLTKQVESNYRLLKRSSTIHYNGLELQTSMLTRQNTMLNRQNTVTFDEKVKTSPKSRKKERKRRSKILEDTFLNKPHQTNKKQSLASCLRAMGDNASVDIFKRKNEFIMRVSPSVELQNHSEKRIKGPSPRNQNILIRKGTFTMANFHPEIFKACSKVINILKELRKQRCEDNKLLDTILKECSPESAIVRILFENNKLQISKLSGLFRLAEIKSSLPKIASIPPNSIKYLGKSKKQYFDSIEKISLAELGQRQAYLKQLELQEYHQDDTAALEKIYDRLRKLHFEVKSHRLVNDLSFIYDTQSKLLANNFSTQAITSPVLPVTSHSRLLDMSNATAPVDMFVVEANRKSADILFKVKKAVMAKFRDVIEIAADRELGEEVIVAAARGFTERAIGGKMWTMEEAVDLEKDLVLYNK